MKSEITINSFSEYIKNVESISHKDGFIFLFRGQNVDKPLLPSIARDNPKKETKELEIEIITELKRRAIKIDDSIKLKNNWDWLVYAQHFGLKTRLLDWTSNPLVALFFSCMDYDDSDSYVYRFIADKSMQVNKRSNLSPFSITSTKVLRPPQNNDRIIAQSGWFTAHAYSNSSKRFISLEKNKKTINRIQKYRIPNNIKEEIMEKLHVFGINYQTMYPDFDGICEQLNWEYEL